MNWRIIKLIFLFVVLAPVQDTISMEKGTEESSDSQDHLSSQSIAATSESHQFDRSVKNFERKQSNKSQKRQQSDFFAGFQSEPIKQSAYHCGGACSSNQFGEAKISSDLLKFCYRSKSSRSLPDLA